MATPKKTTPAKKTAKTTAAAPKKATATKRKAATTTAKTAPKRTAATAKAAKQPTSPASEADIVGSVPDAARPANASVVDDTPTEAATAKLSIGGFLKKAHVAATGAADAVRAEVKEHTPAAKGMLKTALGKAAPAYKAAKDFATEHPKTTAIAGATVVGGPLAGVATGAAMTEEGQKAIKGGVDKLKQAGKERILRWAMKL